ncbi:hypothetical protein P3S68_022464 [Capsicum galapagoense]
MEPPKIRKMVGRPKHKRGREKNEARMREGLWSRSRKGLKMTCGHCSTRDHNQRICPLLQRRTEVLQDFASSTQQISQPIDVVGPSNKKRKATDKPVAPSKRPVKNNTAASSIV